MLCLNRASTDSPRTRLASFLSTSDKLGQHPNRPAFTRSTYRVGSLQRPVVLLDAEYAGKCKQTRKELFLIEWNRWCRGRA